MTLVFSQTVRNTSMPIIANFILVVLLEINKTNEVCNFEIYSSYFHGHVILHLLLSKGANKEGKCKCMGSLDNTNIVNFFAFVKHPRISYR